MSSEQQQQKHSDPTEGTVSVVCPFPSSNPNEITTIKLDLTIPIQKTREQRLAEEAAEKRKKEQEAEAERKRKEAEEEAQRKKKQDEENSNNNSDEDDKKNQSTSSLENMIMSGSINEIKNPVHETETNDDCKKGDEDKNEKSQVSTADPCEATGSSIAISHFDSPKKHEKEEKEKEKEKVPLWALDTLGFFLITKEGEGTQPYAPNNHKFAAKFFKRLEQHQIPTNSKTDDAAIAMTIKRASSSLISADAFQAKDASNAGGSGSEENGKIDMMEMAEYKCRVLSDAVKEKIEWWKIRARELDASMMQAATSHSSHHTHHRNNNNHNNRSNNNSTTNDDDDDHNDNDENEKRNTNNNQMQTKKINNPGNELSSWRRILLHEIRVKVRRQGITPAERVVAWPLLGGLEYDRSARLEGCMEALETRSIDHEMREVMLRDLGRTLPTHSLFRGAGSLGQTRLERVLVCYCALDPEVGYCQGMGFIVAVLLLHMPEADAFGLFVQMMHSKRYQMRGLFQSGFPLLQRMLELFRRILRLVLPQLMEHFDNLGIDPAFFASHWFLTLFSYQFSVPVVCRIWDLFLSEGWIWIYRVAIALLVSDQETLMSMSMEDILMHVKLIHEGKSDDEILRLAKQVPIRESDLVALESEYLEVGGDGGGGESGILSGNSSFANNTNGENNNNLQVIPSTAVGALSGEIVGDGQAVVGETNYHHNITRRFP